MSDRKSGITGTRPAAKTNKRTKTGRFARERQPWDGSAWNDGYRDNRGRFRVYRPDCPRAFASGYCLRSHVVYWLDRGEVHPPGHVLHHINEVRDDDRIENLKVFTKGQHLQHHRTLPDVVIVCENCKNQKRVKGSTWNAKRKQGIPIKFCSQACYHASRKKEK